LPCQAIQAKVSGPSPPPTRDADGLLLASAASGQASRTWVSGVGDDANSCSRTAPCATFAGALAKTAAGGEIDALAPGNFGAVTIDKAITLDGLLGSATSGITVAAGASDVVVLRHLALTGAGSGSGVSFVSGAALHVESCTVANFTDGVTFTPAAGGRLDLVNVEVAGNPGAGVRLSSGAPGHPAVATVARSRLTGNGSGLVAGDSARAVLFDVVVAGSALAGVVATPTGGGAAEVNLEGVVLTGNAVGLQAGGPSGSALVRLSKTVALDGGTATAVGANARLLSFGNNRIEGLVPGLCSAGGNLVTPDSLPVATVGAPFTAALALTNAMGPVALSLTGDLPPGLTFAQGSISGTPTAGGSYALTAQAQDTNGCVATRAYQLAVPDLSLAVSPDPAALQVAGSASLAVIATPVGGFAGTLELSCAGLPAGVSCSFDQPSLSLAGGAATATLTLSTAPGGAAGALDGRGGRPWSRGALIAVFASALIFVAGRGALQRPLQARMVAVSGLGLAAGLVLACSSRSPSPPVSPSPVTPGTYTFQVIATPTAGAPTHHADVGLVVLQ
jgi:hypothetical protein